MAILLLAGLSGCARTREAAQLIPADVMKIEIFPSLWDRPGKPPELITLTELEDFQAIITVIQPVGEADRAKIRDVAKMIIQEKTGKKILLQMQPGTDPDCYEYLGQGKAFKVARKPFLTVMHRVGATWLPE